VDISDGIRPACKTIIRSANNDFWKKMRHWPPYHEPVVVGTILSKVQFWPHFFCLVGFLRDKCEFSGFSFWAIMSDNRIIGSSGAVFHRKPAISLKRGKIRPGYYWWPIGSRICAFDWCQNQLPWMTLKGHYVLRFKTHASFGIHHENVNEDIPIVSAMKI